MSTFKRGDWICLNSSHTGEIWYRHYMFNIGSDPFRVGLADTEDGRIVIWQDDKWYMVWPRWFKRTDNPRLEGL